MGTISSTYSVGIVSSESEVMAKLVFSLLVAYIMVLQMTDGIQWIWPKESPDGCIYYEHLFRNGEVISSPLVHGNGIKWVCNCIGSRWSNDPTARSSRRSNGPTARSSRRSNGPTAR